MSSGRDTMCTMAARCVKGSVVFHFSGLLRREEKRSDASVNERQRRVDYSYLVVRRWRSKVLLLYEEFSALAPSPETAKGNDFFLPYQTAVSNILHPIDFDREWLCISSMYTNITFHARHVINVTS